MNIKSLSSLVLVLFITFVISDVFAADTGKMLRDFREESERLIFENEFGNSGFSAEDLFKATNKINIFDSIREKAQGKREDIEGKRQNILDEIFSLEESLKNLDEDISYLNKDVIKINSDIIEAGKKINNSEATIEHLTKLIANNKKTLRDYTVYLYKKGNLLFDDGDIDSLKAVILNSERLDEVVNDIYYKELISVAGRKLIERHRGSILSLYEKKKELEEDNKNLKKLRKDVIIKKKVLESKKAFKERVLAESKGKDSLYKKYIKGQLDIERELKVKGFKERIKINEISKDLLAKYGCKYVDLSKNTTEFRTLSGNCLDLNKMVYAESQLKPIADGTVNVLDWPITPSKGISAHYKEKEYEEIFGESHDGLDIVADQGTNIIAPLDGYVTYIKYPTDPSYAFIALKHANGFVTVYGHVSEVLVEKYDFVRSGQVFAKTGGEFGTPGAGYLSTGPHLHMEVFKDESRRDPMNYLNASYLNFSTLPEKYRYKFYADYRELTGSEYKEEERKGGKVFKLDGDTEIERQKNLLAKYARSDFNNWNIWVEEALDWDVDPTFLMCIGLAESGLGSNLKSSYNVGNIGNNDRGDVWNLTSPRQGIYWIGKTLNNRYFADVNSVAWLSGAGRKAIGGPACTSENPCYATDTNHWHDNVTKCMSFIKGRYIPNDYNFRLNR